MDTNTLPPHKTLQKFSVQDRKALYEAWQTSGLSKNSFCRLKNIPTSTFYTWCAAYQKSTLKKSNFIPVTTKKTRLVPPMNPSTESIRLDINLPNQMRLTIHLTCTQVLSVLKGLSHADSIIH